MSRMAQAAAKHAGAVNDAAGEPLKLLPKRKSGRGGGVGGDDPSRQAVEFLGTVTRRPVMLQRTGNGAQGGTNAQLTDAVWQVGFPAVLGLDVQAGDHVERLDPPPGEPASLRLYAPMSIRGRTIHPADQV